MTVQFQSHAYVARGRSTLPSLRAAVDVRAASEGRRKHNVYTLCPLVFWRLQSEELTVAHAHHTNNSCPRCICGICCLFSGIPFGVVLRAAAEARLNFQEAVNKLVGDGDEGDGLEEELLEAAETVGKVLSGGRSKGQRSAKTSTEASG